MISEEEQQAIKYLQNEIIDIQKDIDFHLDKENIIPKEELKAKQTILNLISKLQKENEDLKERNRNLLRQADRDLAGRIDKSSFTL